MLSNGRIATGNGVRNVVMQVWSWQGKETCAPRAASLCVRGMKASAFMRRRKRHEPFVRKDRPRQQPEPLKLSEVQTKSKRGGINGVPLGMKIFVGSSKWA